MQDLCSGSLTLERFKAVVFVGGFSYADVLGSAKGKYPHTQTPRSLWYTDVLMMLFTVISPTKGWAATVTYNPKAKAEFDRFRQRDDTLSLGVCNGCQLLALLGWVGDSEDGAGKRRMQGNSVLGITVTGKHKWASGVIWDHVT